MNNSNISKTHIDYIDIAKGLGIFIVILGHTLPNLPQYHFWTHLIYNFHMPFFFILAGMVISDKQGALKLISSRAIKLIGIIASAAILNFSILSFQGTIGTEASVKTLLHFFSVRLGSLWFLWALLIAISFVILLRQTPYATTIILLIAILAYFLNKSFPVKYFFILQGLICAPFVHIGYLIKKNNLLLFRPRSILLILSTIFLIYISIFPNMTMIALGFFPYGVWSIVAALAGSYIFLCLSKFIDSYKSKNKLFTLGKSFLIWTGKITLLILLVHSIENQRFTLHLLHDGETSVALVFILRILFIFIVIIIIEQIKKYIRGLLNSRYCK